MIGAGRSERVSAVVRIGLRMNVAVTGAIVVLTYGLAPVILGLFLTDRAVQALALQLLHIAGWSVIVLGGANVLVGVMRGSGAVLVPTSLGMAAIVVVELPLAYTLNARLGMTGIWWSYAAAFVTMLVLQAAYYRLGWRRRAINRLI
jgi:Na+-driven multidrug efflux pump